MKCPKCGSDNVRKGITPTNDEYDYECQNCLYPFDYEDTEEYLEKERLQMQVAYQQRLDKVLSKFEKNRNPKSNEYYYNWENGLLMAIDIDRETKFSLYNNEFPIYISLDTVESLIKDLERRNKI